MSNQTQNTQNLPSTPDWSKAPKWANYFAIDGKGVGYWHEKTPFRMGESWHNFATVAKAGLFNSMDWERSFQRRPKIEIPSGQPTIDWAKAPDWANYFAIDKSGEGWWFEKTPILIGNYWKPDSNWGSRMLFCNSGFDSASFEKSLQQRPKIENLTVQLNTDISGYLAGENSFITGLVDLLLARMAKEERFSESEFFSSEPVQVNDIVVFESEYDNRTCYGLVDAVANSNWAATAWIGRVMEYIDGEWCHRRGKFFDLEEISIRPINELEAVEFRKAMEAVYG